MNLSSFEYFLVVFQLPILISLNILYITDTFSKDSKMMADYLSKKGLCGQNTLLLKISENMSVFLKSIKKYLQKYAAIKSSIRIMLFLEGGYDEIELFMKFFSVCFLC